MKEQKDEDLTRIFVLAKVSPGSLEDFIKGARHLEGVAMASSVTGAYDSVVIIEADSPARALKVVLKGVRAMKGVEETQTLVEVPIE